MLETSKDLLNIVIAFCVLWFTVFLCWFIYYIVMIIKRVSNTAENLAKMAENVTEFIDEAKDKLKSATSYIPLIFEGVKNLSNYLTDKQTEASKPKTKKKKK